MTREQARDRIDRGDMTWGHLKAMLRAEIGARPRVAKVNKGMTHEQAITILAKGIESRPDEEIVCGPKSWRPKLDRLSAMNVLRECSEPKR
mgnify:CR=1 FL=1